MIPDEVAVSAAKSVVAWVEVVRYLSHLGDSNIIWKLRVQGTRHGFRGQLCVCGERDDLSHGVRTGIGSTRTDHRHGRLDDRGNCLFEGGLHCYLARLTLKARVCRAGVLDNTTKPARG